MTFIDSIACDLMAHAEQLHQYTIVFPMHRAEIFLKEALKKRIAASDKPILSPKVTTIGQLVGEMSRLDTADELTLICALYDIYVSHTREDGKKTMSLDVFYGWGKQLLTDFSNVDMADVNARELFENAAESKELDLTSLDEEVRERLSGLLHPNRKEIGESILEDYRRLYKHLPAIYDDLQEWMEEHRQGYEGARLKDVNARIQDILPTLRDRHFVFAGFNYLLGGERKLMDALREQSTFYWDYRPSFHTNHSAYRFIEKNIKQFANAYHQEAVSGVTPVTVVATTSNQAQVQYVHEWLSQQDTSLPTAVVITDESVLESVVYALPDSLSEKVNITKGFPLSHTAVFSQVTNYLERPEWEISRPDTFSVVLEQLITHLRGELQKDLDANPLRENAAIPWQVNLKRESYYQTLNVLERFLTLVGDGTLHAAETLKTLRLLIRRHLETVALPFNGEPYTPVQVIGVLETRLLDFENLLILNVEEGTVPQVKNDNSFIPYYLRKYYQMETNDEASEAYAYNFFRLLRRSKQVTMLFSNATTGSGKKSMSRFLMQMMTSDEFAITRRAISEPCQAHQQAFDLSQSPFSSWREKIEKNPKKKATLSPSAIGSYLKCKRKFFFEKVMELSSTETPGLILAQNELGSLIHGTIQAAYDMITDEKYPATIRPQQIEEFLKDPDNLNRALEKSYQQINENFRKHNPSVQEDVFVPDQHKAENIVAKGHARKVLENDKQTQGLTIYNQEQYVSFTMTFEDVTIQVGGIIDRLDSIVEDGKKYTRILDYKTGTYSKEKLQTKTLEHLFDCDGDKNYILQTLIYATACLEGQNNLSINTTDPIMPSLLFTQNSMQHFDPHLYIGDKVVSDFKGDFMDELKELLRKKIEEMLNDTQFDLCKENECSAYCPFLILCNRKAKQWN